MPKAQKLKSGNYRVRVFTHEENGVKKFVSFTYPTKEEAEYQAALYQRKYKGSDASMTFAQAYENYIKERSNVLSPNTLREYKRSQKEFEDLDVKQIYKITTADIQRHINVYSAARSPKTVRNHHGLITAVLKYYRPDFTPNTKLPQKEHKEIAIPTEKEVQAMMEYCRKKCPEMLIPVMLGAFGPCRRGETCALTLADMSDAGVIHICKSYAQNENKEWVIKRPKSYSGDRYIPLPQFVYQEIVEQCTDNALKRITELMPEDITHKFWHVSKNATGKVYRYHDLRHFCASFLHSSGMSNSAICQRCGWKNDRVLLEIYRHAIKEESDTENDSANDAFSKKFSKVDTKVDTNSILSN